MAKKLVVCFDGTWNNADSGDAETNVSLMARAIRATPQEVGKPQIVLYLRGVGATGLAVQRVLEGATGLGLDDNIRSAYMFIAQNYIPGDAIYLFGFSRGAFSARSLAGLIGSCGILRRENLADLGRAWRYYKTTKVRSPEDFVARHKTKSHVDATIEFMGVWDTVGALGIPASVFGEINQREYGFHDTTPSRITRHAYHAMAVDEFRDEFVPTFWTGEKPAECKELHQVWFAGAHSDVGGGYVDRALANIPLLWMARKAEGCGLELDRKMLGAFKVDTNAPHHDSRRGWTIFDRVTPTFRAVCETGFDVTFNETLYRPVVNDVVQPTIGEKVHQSVIDRFGTKAQFSDDDGKKKRVKMDYLPRNIAPFFGADGKFLNTAPVDNTV